MTERTRTIWTVATSLAISATIVSLGLFDQLGAVTDAWAGSPAYKCYKVKDASAQKFVPTSGVGLSDGFGLNDSVAIGKPTLFCPEAEYDSRLNSSITTPSGCGLCCYKIKNDKPNKFESEYIVNLTSSLNLTVGIRDGNYSLQLTKPTSACEPCCTN